MRGTVRSLKNEEKTAHLRALNEALPGKLSLYEADLLEVCVPPEMLISSALAAGWMPSTRLPVYRRGPLMRLWHSLNYLFTGGVL